MTCTIEERETAADDQEQLRKTERSCRSATPGSAAEDELVRQHLPLVRMVVGRLAKALPSHVDTNELYSSGLLGLLKAVRDYDPQAGSSFESYARVRIRGAVFDDLRRLDWVPRSVHEKARKLQKALQQLEQKKGRVPTEREISQHLSLSLDEYHELLEEIRPASFVSLHSSAEEPEPSYAESIPDESQPDPLDYAARREMVQTVLNQLPETQRKVLALYYFEDLRMREIAEAFGVTEARICQLHAQAIRTIRAYLTENVLVEF